MLCWCENVVALSVNSLLPTTPPAPVPSSSRLHGAKRRVTNVKSRKFLDILSDRERDLVLLFYPSSDIFYFSGLHSSPWLCPYVSLEWFPVLLH